MDLAFTSDSVDFYLELRGPKLYLHSDVKRWSKSGLKEAMVVIAELGNQLGELYTYAPTQAARKLALLTGFRPTGCTIEAHYAPHEQVDELRLERYCGEYDELVALGERANEHEALAHSLGDEAHGGDSPNHAVGLLIRRVLAGQAEYAQTEYNRWASQNGYVTVTVVGSVVTFNDTTLEIPKCP